MSVDASVFWNLSLGRRERWKKYLQRVNSMTKVKWKVLITLLQKELCVHRVCLQNVNKEKKC